jgi:hypothetical protein
MPEYYKVRTATDFKNGKPVFTNVKKKPEFLLGVSFPISEMTDAETRARAYLGVKHGSVYDTLGIANARIAEKLGFGGSYRRLRLEQATEEENYPELQAAVDQETAQEKSLEKPKTVKSKSKGEKNED